MIGKKKRLNYYKMKKETKEKIVRALGDLKEGYMRCKWCGKIHKQTTSNCCWIFCECGKEICGQCGSTNIGSIDESELDLSSGSDDNYWCCKQCEDCGLQGCGMCV